MDHHATIESIRRSICSEAGVAWFLGRTSVSIRGEKGKENDDKLA
jgi:hypothetical protein